MSNIKILSENLINQIAAGEVVERPASVIKELVENSLDAGATEIIVDVKEAGKIHIKALDNGCGIAKEDMQLALARHATSKIREEADLWKIRTMGFRGEALASIASVSKLVIKSKTEENLGGTQIDSEGGEILSMKDVGMSKGTQIEVYNLFFNTPARQKYLKQTTTEFGHISALINTLALANPGISFKLIHNEKVVTDLPKSTDLISRVADIFGRATAEAMLPIFYGGSEFQMDGFVGKPLLSRSSSQHQYLFVNGRAIQHFLFANTIKNAFHSMLMENKKPVFVLNIKIDPALIDVNVHPRKTEIRFEDQQTMIRVIYSAVKSALEKNNLIPKGFTESQRYMSDNFPKDTENAPRVQGSLSFSKEILAERDFKPLSQFSFNHRGSDHSSIAVKHDEPVSMKSITQIANSYIVAENESGLVLIDQHAAHERVRYEQLMEQFEKQEKSVQPLLVPFQLELASQELNLLEQNMETFKNLGFEIEHFGGSTFVIQAVPSFFAKEDLDQVIKGVLDDILNQKDPSKMQGNIEVILTYMSCRSAIKFGQKLSLDEMQGLLNQMEGLKRPYTCPHGRPTMISLTLDELRKMFGRK